MNSSQPQRRRPTEFAVRWPNRGAMVRQALSQSLPWFAFVNISFALLIALRDRLFDHYDDSLVTHQTLIPVVESGVYLVIAASLLLLMAVWRGQHHLSMLGLTLLTLIGVIWAFNCYCFAVYWQLPLTYPLSVILLLTAVAAFYFYPGGLLCFMLPLWLAVPFASVQLNQGINHRFAIMWLIFTVILIYGRYILLRWFNEAWQRYEQNQLLISRLDMLAHQDVLTGTANRRALENHLSQAITQQRPFSLIMLDVDYFKRYNDHYGHQAGDECLAAVAEVLKEAVRTPEDVVARYGGEEFVVMLVDATVAQAESVAARIQQSFQRRALPHATSDAAAYVTASMGIARAAPGLTAEAIIALADKALYRAKERGRNCWVS